jgi:hypothetical protein
VKHLRGAGATVVGVLILLYVGVQTARGWWIEHRADLLDGATHRLLSVPSLLWIAGAVAVTIGLRVWTGRRPARGITTAVTLADLEPTHGVRNDGSALELLTVELITRDGGRARRCGGAGDRGVDVVGETASGQPVVVQCKQYAADAVIGPDQVRELVGAAAITGRRPLTIFVTTAAGFSDQARAEASGGGVVLIDRPRLDRWMRGAYLPELGPARTPLKERAKGWAGKGATAAAWLGAARDRGRQWRR